MTRWHNRNEQSMLQYKLDHWRERAYLFAQALSHRVNALNYRFFPGCGFHYSTRQDISGLLRRLHHRPFLLDKEIQQARRKYWSYYIPLKVRLDFLVVRVKEAEAYLKEGQ
jgi:hypothetical protein